MRAWTTQHPQGIYLRSTEGLNGEGANGTNPNTPITEESFTPSQHDGIGQQAPGLLPVIIRAGTGTGEVPSACMLGGIPFTPAQKRRCVGTSMLGGRRVLVGVDTSTLEPGARDLSEARPRHPSPGLRGRVLYIKTILISNAGVWVGLLNHFGNPVCSYKPKMVRILRHLEPLKIPLLRHIVFSARTNGSCNFALLTRRTVLCLVTRLVALVTQLLCYILLELLI
jgi:hypothetical protein